MFVNIQLKEHKSFFIVDEKTLTKTLHHDVSVPQA